MPKQAYLVLEDGSVHQGEAFGADTGGQGEVVFNTSMTGYQEVITDPSYAGQLVTLTYPLVGNYGINREDSESPDSAVAQLAGMTRYDDVDYVRTVTTDQDYEWDSPPLEPSAPGHRILVTDCGLKYNILRLLRQRGCQVIALPATTPAEDMLALNPSGILLSPGPGDPQLLDYLVDNVGKLLGRVPIMGICLGHQIVARALGAETFKLKFGHRGANHPVKDLSDGRIYITAQNHGYAVRADSLPPGLEVTHINLNDETIEGLRHRDMPVFTIQYHSEASPGPQDNEYLFDRFLQMVDDVG